MPCGSMSLIKFIFWYIINEPAKMCLMLARVLGFGGLRKKGSEGLGAGMLCVGFCGRHAAAAVV